MRRIWAALFLGAAFFMGVGGAWGDGYITIDTGGATNLGASVVGASTGPVFYGGTGGTLAQDELYWIAATNRLGIGTSSPGEALAVAGNVRTSGAFYSETNTNPAAPPFSFLNSSLSGMYSPSAEALGLSTNGNSRLHIDSAGLVGIGTTSPAGKFDVYGGTLAVTNNGKLRIAADGSMVNQWSLIDLSMTKDFTHAQSTSGVNANGVYTNNTGDRAWGVHANVPAESEAGKGLVAGCHGANQDCNFAVTSSTNAYLFRGYQWMETHTGDLIQLRAAEDWRSQASSGAFTGNFLRLTNATTSRFLIDYTGTITSLAGDGDSVSLYESGTAAVLKANNNGLYLWPAADGNTVMFSTALGGNLLFNVDNTSGDATITPSGGQITVDGGFIPYVRTTAQLEAITPKAAFEYYTCSNCATTGLYRSTGTTVGAFVWEGDGTTVN